MPTSNFQPIRLLDPSCSYKLKYLMTNSVDPDQLVSSEATVCKGWVYLGSAGSGLIIIILIIIIIIININNNTVITLSIGTDRPSQTAIF